MRPIDEKQHFDLEHLKRDRFIAVQTMILQQIETVEKMFERHKDMVLSPMSYNACGGLIDQLKAHAFATFSNSPPSLAEKGTGNAPVKITLIHVRDQNGTDTK